MDDITKVTLAKEKDTGIEYYYPSSSSDIIEHQVKDTEEVTTVKKKLDELEDKIGDINISDIDMQEVVDARVAISDGDTKNDLKTRIDTDYKDLKDKISSGYADLDDKIKKKVLHLSFGGGYGYKYVEFMSGEFIEESTLMLMLNITDANLERYNKGILTIDLSYKDDKININEYGFIYIDTGMYGYADFYLKIDNNKWYLYRRDYITGGSRSYIIQVISDNIISTNKCYYELYKEEDVKTVSEINISDCKPSMQLCAPFGAKKCAATYNNNENKYEYTDIEIGIAATALGSNNIASGYYSTSIGSYNEATGIRSTAIGSSNKALSNDTIAIGASNVITGDGKFNVFGTNNNVSTPYTLSTPSTIVGSNNTITSANRILIFGTGNSADKNAAILGYYNNASKDSFVFGEGNTASNDAAMAIGLSNKINCIGAAIGDENEIICTYNESNTGSFRMHAYTLGCNNTIKDASYTAGIGCRNSISATHGYAYGIENSISGYSVCAIGHYNTINNFYDKPETTDSDYAASHRYSYAVGCVNNIYSAKSCLLGYNNKTGAIPDKSDIYALGSSNRLSASNTIAIGGDNSITNDYSLTLGQYNKSVRRHSVLIGTCCSDDINDISYTEEELGTGSIYKRVTYRAFLTNDDNPHDGFSIAMGKHCFSTADSAVSIGDLNWCHSVGGFVCGICSNTWQENSKGNVRTSIYTNTNGYAFIVGNGYYESSNSRDATSSNAFRVNNDGAIYANGAYNTSGADYAEFIKEWYDGNPNNEDRVGYMVTIGEDGLLHKANEGDYIIGITSGNPSIIGNADEEYYWKYVRDKFNRFIYIDVEIEETKTDDNGNAITEKNIYKNGRKKISEDYDPSQPYIERAKRPEWDYVGMRGIIPCRDDGTCVARGFCKCGTDGIATKADTRGFDTYYVIERIDEETISVEVR